jgi:hypothetical protein
VCATSTWSPGSVGALQVGLVSLLVVHACVHTFRLSQFVSLFGFDRVQVLDDGLVRQVRCAVRQKPVGVRVARG